MTQVIESVAFSPVNYYDQLQFMTNSGKLRTCQGGLKTITLTKNRPTVKINIRIRPKVKRMNPYTFFGVLINLPIIESVDQIGLAADVTDIDHVEVNMKVRYNEWNQNFNFQKV